VVAFGPDRAGVIEGDEVMSRTRPVVASAAVLSVVLALGAPTSEAAGGRPVSTPVVPSTLTAWGAAGPVIGTPRGTLMGEGSVRSTAAPATRVALTPAVKNLVLGTHASLSLKYASRTVFVDDNRAVGSMLTATTATTRSATLWALDLTTGAAITRAVSGLPSSVGLVGSDGTAWVTAALSGPATRWPFDGSAASAVAPPDLDRVLAVGDLGVVYLTLGDATLASRLLRLAPRDDGSTVTLADFVGSGATPADVAAATASGSVGWSYGDTVGYWDAVTGTVRTTVSTWGSPVTITVMPGALSLVWASGFTSPGWNDVWRTWVPSVGTLAPLSLPATFEGSSPALVWSSATTTGAPAFGLIRVLDFDTPALRSVWSSWVPGGPDTLVLPAPSAAAGINHAHGSVGTLLMTYHTGLTGPPGANNMSVVLRRVGPTSTPVVFTDTRAVETLWSGPDPGYGISGTRTAIPEYIGTTARQQIVLRDGARITGRVPLGSAEIEAMASSGAYTLYATRAAGALFSVVRWTGPDGVAHLVTKTGTTNLAQDGSLSAYQTPDGWVWLRDESAPVSATNPRKVVRPPGTSAASRTSRIWLSGGELVVSYYRNDRFPVGDRLIVADLARRTSRDISVAWSCDDMTGHVLVCRDLDTGLVATLDIGARTLAFRTVVGATLPVGARFDPELTFVGRLLARASTIDPHEGWATTMTIAALPLPNRDVSPTRVLGPWNATGTTLARGRTAASCWVPVWSLTDPASAFTVTLRDPTGRVVRTWHGTSPDGVIRGVSWCASPTAMTGTYRWTLTGRNAYGPIRATLGNTLPTGTFRVRRP